MRSDAYVGRVAGLAVALGVSAAMVTGWSSGLAWADESGESRGSAVSGVASGANPATAKSGATGIESESSRAAHGSAKSGGTGATSTTNTGTAAGGSTKKEDEVRSEVSTPTSKTPESETAASPPTDDDAGPIIKPTTPKRSHPIGGQPTKPKTSAPVSKVADAKHDAIETATTTTEGTTDAVSRLSGPVAKPTERPEVTSPAIASTHSSSVSTPNAKLTPASTPPNVMSVVSGLVSVVVNAILSPFAATDAPGAPAATPSVWSLLAFVRREFENAFTAPSLTDKPVDAQTTSETRTLVLTAFPAEADAVLARTTLDPNPSVVVDGHHFYLGALGGKKVIVAMTGIGMVNATQTTEIALDHFTPESGISIGAVVFSGVAGGSGRTEIGSVAVPARWTSDDGATWHAVDSAMLSAANTLNVDLLSSDTIGDPACACGLLAGPQIDLKREPQLFVGGDGSSDDNNNGTAFPSIPLGGDIFGPQPCAAPDFSPLFTGNFFQALAPFLAGGLLSNLTGLLAPVAPAVDAVDQETAAAQQVADAHGIPFLGIRGMSDGPGDPLNLPGYPFTFFVYKQIAADNAAIVTEAFLHTWAGA
jgi:nucleoside phosphorylase